MRKFILVTASALALTLCGGLAASQQSAPSDGPSKIWKENCGEHVRGRINKCDYGYVIYDNGDIRVIRMWKDDSDTDEFVFGHVVTAGMMDACLVKVDCATKIQEVILYHDPGRPAEDSRFVDQLLFRREIQRR